MGRRAGVLKGLEAGELQMIVSLDQTEWHISQVPRLLTRSSFESPLGAAEPSGFVVIVVLAPFITALDP
jgi:hypothetical protein